MTRAAWMLLVGLLVGLQAGTGRVEGDRGPLLPRDQADPLLPRQFLSDTPTTLLPQQPDFAPVRDGPSRPAQAAPKSSPASRQTACG